MFWVKNTQLLPGPSHDLSLALSVPTRAPRRGIYCRLCLSLFARKITLKKQVNVWHGPRRKAPKYLPQWDKLLLWPRTSQRSVTEECSLLAALRRAWPPLSAERVKMLMRSSRSSEGLNKVFISCRLTFIYLFTRNVLPLSSIISPDRACLVFSAAVRAAIVWAQIAALARQPLSLIIPSDYL